MELKKVRIELPGETYAVVFKDILRKTARLHEEELKKAIKRPDDTLISLKELKPGTSLPKPDIKLDWWDLDNGAINEIFILNQVAEWPFGPIDRDTLEMKVSKEQYEKLVEEMDRLYQPSPLESVNRSASN